MYELHMERLPRTVELVEAGESLAFRYIDQRLLPGELRVVETSDWLEVVHAIKELAVRGAPAIGLAGASALALWVSGVDSRRSLGAAADCVSCARPTAVNLSWAVNRALAALAASAIDDVDSFNRALARDVLYAEVKLMEAEDEAACRAIGVHGASLLPNGARVLTHCNAGSLATSFYGTALGVVYAAAERGKVARVYADETRPVCQGARLTAWELARAGVPVTLICDNMAASVMASGGVDAVVVGADRIACNGDMANKIGSYGVAILAREHGIPFYVAAPSSTIDSTIADGSEIPIEQRDGREVLAQPIEGVEVYNPAFDVTPAHLITAFITETGVYSPSEVAAVRYSTRSSDEHGLAGC